MKIFIRNQYGEKLAMLNAENVKFVDEYQS